MEINISSPLREEQARKLRAGNRVLISGTVYTARDAAHKRLYDLHYAGEPFPFDIKDAVIYYAGPTPAKPGQAIGSVGPTTSTRMDAYTPCLLDLGLRGMIGKGLRSERVVEHMKKNGAVYFGAIGGAGALISQCVVKSEIIAYEDLGSEAIRRLEVKDFPAIVVIDSMGGNLYESGPEDYLEHLRKTK